MDILVVESEYESTGQSEILYNSFTDANVDVYNHSDLDADEMRNDYDVVLSDLALGDGVMGPDVLDQFDADRKALYTAWRQDEAGDRSSISDALEEYQVITKPREYLDLKTVISEYLVPE